MSTSAGGSTATETASTSSSSSRPAWGQLAVPPLRAGQRLAEWAPLFRAAVAGLVASGNEEFAIALLPGYVNRSVAERELCAEIVCNEKSLKVAIETLLTLDPPVDKMQQMHSLCRLDWRPGVLVDDFYYDLRRRARFAGDCASLKFVCNLFIGQMPPSVQAKLLAMLGECNDPPTDAQARTILVKAKELLVEKNVPLTHGCSDFDRMTASGFGAVSTAAISAVGTDGDGHNQIRAAMSNVPLQGGEVASVRQGQASDLGRKWSRGGGQYRPRAATQPVQSQGREMRRCFVCGSPDHLMRACTKRCCQRCGKKGHDLRDCSADSVAAVTSRELSSSSAFVKAFVAENEALVLLDTGASTSVIDSSSLSLWGLLDQVDTGSKPTLYGVTKFGLPVVGSATLDVLIGSDVHRRVRFAVLSSTERTLILGRDFLKSFAVTSFDWTTNTIHLDSECVQAELSVCGGSHYLDRSKVVAEVEATDVGISAEFDISPGLTEDQRGRFQELLESFNDVFADNPRKPNLTHLGTHSIETVGPPVKQRSFRMSPSLADEVDKQVAEMLENGVCRPSKSPWSSKVILARKKDGSMRFIVDYRGLNDVTKKDAYPMPQIPDIIDRMDGSRFFSVTDGASAFWSVPLEESSKEKTAFSVPRGHFEMNVLAFGMTNAPAAYQRIHDAALRGLSHSSAYVDDACTYSASFEAHLDHVRDLLRAYRAAGLQLKKQKCKFGYTEVDFAGVNLSASGIRPVSSNVDAIKNFPAPTTLKGVQRFTAMANYYRSFIRDLSTIAAPLYQLSTKGTPFRWQAAEQAAFETVKAALASRPVLSFVQWDADFYVETDASREGIGGVLSQLGDCGRRRPVAFFSCRMDSAQRNYSATELECYALVVAARKWRVYLQAARSVVFYTDHNPLVWLRSQRDPRGKFARWLAELEYVPYRVEYKRGADNAVADALSRAPSDEAAPEFVSSIAGAPHRVRELRDEQAADQSVQEMRARIGEPDGQTLSVDSGIVLRDGKICVPASLAAEYATAIHNECHFGIDKTLSAVQHRFDIRDARRIVSDVCRRCDICQRMKACKRPSQPLQPIFLDEDRPRHAIAYDIATLPFSTDAHRYVLVIVDLFSRYTELVAMHDQRAESVTEALLANWICRHGRPAVMLSDQGRNVDGEAVRDLCARWGIEKRHSSAYHPETDGLAERTIQTVKATLRTIMAESLVDRQEWPQILARVAFAMNNSVNASTGVSPHLIMFGEDLAPLSALPSSPRRPPSALPAVWADAAANLRKAKASQKRFFDRRHHATPAGVAADDFVLVAEPSPSALEPRYDGPFRVLQRRGPSVELEFANGNRWVHLNRCRVYNEPAVPTMPAVVVPAPAAAVPEEVAHRPPELAAEQPEAGLRRSVRTRRPVEWPDFVVGGMM